MSQRIATTMELEKKKELEKLLVERDLLYERERILLREIAQFRKSYYADKQQEYRGKVVPIELKYERRQNFRNLSSIKEDLEIERRRLLFNFDKIRNNQLGDLKKNKTGVSTALEVLKPFMNNDSAIGKIKEDADRLNDMKRSLLARDDLYTGSPMDTGKNGTFSRYVMDTFSKPETAQERATALSLVRAAVEKDGVEEGMARAGARVRNVNDSMVSQNAIELQNSLLDVSRVKRDAMLAKNQDRILLENTQKLERHYQNQSMGALNASNLLANPIDPNNASYLKINKHLLVNNDYRELSKLLPDANDTSSIFNPVQSMINIKTAGRHNTNLSEHTMILDGLSRANMTNWNGNSSMMTNGNPIFRTVEEKQLADLKAEEERVSRILAGFPYGSDEFRSNSNRLGEVKRKIAELEKIVLEQRTLRTNLQKSKGVRFAPDDSLVSYNNTGLGITSQRGATNKSSLRNRTAITTSSSNFGNNVNSHEGGTSSNFRKYSPFEGFVVHFDFITDIPKKFESGNLTYGIYASGQTLVAPKSTDTHFTQQEDKHSAKMMMGEKHSIYDVQLKQEALLIMELQFAKMEGPVEKFMTLGWTAINIFDMKPDLMRGRFKLPLYKPPTDTSIVYDNVVGQQKLPNVKVFMRISYGGNDEISSDFNMHSDSAFLGYLMPAIHTEKIGWRNNPNNNNDADFDVDQFKDRENEIFDLIKHLMDEEKMPLEREVVVVKDDSELPADVLEALRKKMEELGMTDRPPRPITPPPPPPPPPPKEKKFRKKEKPVVIIEKPKPPPIVKSKELAEIDAKLADLNEVLNVKKGMKVIIQSVNNYDGEKAIGVTIGAFYGPQIMEDDRGNTMIKDTKRNESANKKKGKMNVEFDDIFYFLKNMEGLVHMSKNKRPLFIGIQLFENPGESTEKMIAWTLYQFTKKNGQIIFAKNTEKLYLPPIKPPPLDPKVNTESPYTLSFTTELFEYDAKVLANLKL